MPRHPALRQACIRLGRPEPKGAVGREHYLSTLAALEEAMWQEPERAHLASYQALFRELSGLPWGRLRHQMVVVIPVADRPRQLRECIGSLFEAGRHFGHASDLRLVVVEDSLQAASRDAHADAVREARSAGLDAHHLDLDEQWGLLQSLAGEQVALVGVRSPDAMGHKGASVTRNIAMLWLARQGWDRPLFHFVDSDQVFHVDGVQSPPRYQIHHAWHIDRLFDTHPIQVMTGKVVGDPPVSPAVMAGTLLRDLRQIFDRALPELDAPCGFHGGGEMAHGAYHDMASLFGLDNRNQPAGYPCPLSGPHSHADALRTLGERLGRFFDGEHPTRRSEYSPVPPDKSLRPARTVYTGNYVINRAGLRHCIPFAPMRLRMAGPTLGRLLQAKLGEAFVQVNLPMLHRRAGTPEGRAEFRSGVHHGAGGVDLSDEYCRQFVGDLMLFSVAGLVTSGYPERTVERQTIVSVLRDTEERLLAEYRATRGEVLQALQAFQDRLTQGPDLAPELQERLARFLHNVQRNYGEQAPAVCRIEDRNFREDWRRRLEAALLAYPRQQEAWERLI